MLLFMIGTAVGSLAIGYLADRFHRIHLLLTLSCVTRAALFVAIAPFIVGARWSAIPNLAVFTLGFIGGGTVPLLLKLMKEIYGFQAIGTGSSLNATFAGLLAALSQPILGMILNSRRNGQTSGTGALFPAEAFDLLLVTLAGVSLAGIAGIALIAKSSALSK